ncbi:hypothetical protein [Hyphomicrobium sp. CS1GBMeth3]|uniref:hypothetical protein n=1 Tax=Hyphomicrobium sp. CS1GBMeth3 TaxID=1892845 RepID=UPI00093080CF|nr:hypothetical protein [Hyphomicrobium sp. CS1GBMeth3]
MRTGSRLRSAATGLLVATGPWCTEAQAGKYCGDPLEGGLSSGVTQEEAIEAAQQWWSSRAGALGRGYQDWDNADDRALECSKNMSGKFQCQATARPCLPEGTLPDDLPKLDM